MKTSFIARGSLFVTLLFALGCGGNSQPAADSASSASAIDEQKRDSACEDEDGDGFGLHCDLGDDCNDDDDTVSDDCSCMKPEEGCECDEDAEPVECELSAAELRGSSTTLCKTGVQYCRDGAWTGCVGIAAFDL